MILPFYTAGLIGYATHLQIDGILLQFGRRRTKESLSLVIKPKVIEPYHDRQLPRYLLLHRYARDKSGYEGWLSYPHAEE